LPDYLSILLTYYFLLYFSDEIVSYTQFNTLVGTRFAYSLFKTQLNRVCGIPVK
jgi:hypothetical protein